LLWVPTHSIQNISGGLGIEKSRVLLLNGWDAKRPSIGNMMGSFYAYLVSYKIKSESGLPCSQ